MLRLVHEGQILAHRSASDWDGQALFILRFGLTGSALRRRRIAAA